MIYCILIHSIKTFLWILAEITIATYVMVLSSSQNAASMTDQISSLIHRCPGLQERLAQQDQ